MTREPAVSRRTGLFVTWLSALCVCVPASGAAPRATPGVHLGVASCAGSDCHGNDAVTGSAQGMLHNEYLTWQRDDAHARAFHSLLTPESFAIGKRLGIPDPSHSDTCIKCHADDVPAALRGPRFSLEDGVGCEACHGGASGWIADHAMAKRSHADNVRQGMYPTENPAERAQLCLGCHYGSPDRLMSHAILAAGHPPLLFELTTYTAVEPAHYRVDADYRKRKSYQGPAETWALGQVVAAGEVLEGLGSRAFPAAIDRPPDFYLYNCYSCHQPLRRDSDLSIESDVPVPGGPLRLATSNLAIVEIILMAADPDLGRRWGQALAGLHAAQDDASQITAIKHLQPMAAEAVNLLSKQPLSAQARRQIALQLIQAGSRTTQADHSFADQTVMALTVLSHAEAESGQPGGVFGGGFPASLDAAYGALKNSSDFDVVAYRKAMNDMEQYFKNN